MTFDAFRSVVLGDLGDFRNGVNFSASAMGRQSETSHALINVKDIFSSGTYLDVTALDGVNLAPSRSVAESGMCHGDIYFVRSSVKRSGVGAVSVATTSDERVVHCGFVIRLRLGDSQVDPTFLAYALGSPVYRERVVALSGGSAITNLSQGALGRLAVTVPPLPIQRKIVAVLSAYDDLIENNGRRIQLWQEMALRIYSAWFIDFRYPGHEKVALVDSTLGRIPAGWDVVNLSRVVHCVRDSVTSGAGTEGVPYVPIECITAKSLCLRDWQGGENAKTSLIRFMKSDILFGAMRPYFHKVAIAPFVGTTRSTCLVLRPTEPHLRAFAVMRLFDERTIDYATRHSSGTTIPYARWTRAMEVMPTLLPPRATVESFERLVQPFLQALTERGAMQAKLRATRDLLLPRLVSGELDIADIDPTMVESGA